MHPVLFSVRVWGGNWEVHAFGVMVAVGCAVAIGFAMREARRRGDDVDAMRDLCFWALVAALVGARAAFVIMGGRAGWDDCLDAAANGGWRAALGACTRPARFWEGGLVFYGGLAAGTAAAMAYARRRGLKWWRVADVLAPSVALGHVFGRLGCFLAGCCFGKGTAAAIGMRFPEGSVAFLELSSRGALGADAVMTGRLHPTQLYEAVGELLIFGVLVWMGRGRRRDGDLALIYLAAYSVLRFGIEIFRGDVVRSFVWEMGTPGFNRWMGLSEGAASFLSTGQAMSLGVIAAVGVIAVVRRRVVGN